MIFKDKWIVIDIEANGLLHDATQIWCISFKILGEEKSHTISCKDVINKTPGAKPISVIESIIFEMSQYAKGIIGHNIITYDIPLLERLFNVSFSQVHQVDTLVMSRVLNPDLFGGHSLANWMKILQLNPKVQQEQWKEYNENMLVRCQEDMEATEKVYNHLLSTYKITHEQFPWYMEMEHRFAHICHQITQKGLYLDDKLCIKYIEQLQNEIHVLDAQLRPKIPSKQKKYPTLKNIFKKNGDPSTKMTAWIGSGNPYKIIPGIGGNSDMERYVMVEPNFGNPDTFRDYLLSLGWKPREDPDAWNYKTEKTQYGKLVKVKGPNGRPIRTSPKLPKKDTELEELEKISGDFALVSKRILRAHRLGVIKGYFENYDKGTNRIHMGLNSCGCYTSRVKHSVVANIPKVKSYLGKEMRGLFRASPGLKLAGCDMSGLELRVLAHYLNNKEFTEMVLRDDIHDFLFEKLGQYVLKRDDAKNLTYAFLYGGGNQKLGSMCNKISSGGDLLKIGKEVRNVYLTYIPNLADLVKKLEASYDRTGGFKALDGRFIRARNKYSILNTLGQSAGSILAKNWTCEFMNQYYKFWHTVKGAYSDETPPFPLIAYMHDEIIAEPIDPILNEEIGKIMVDSIRITGEKFKLNCPLDGAYKVGDNWSEIH